MPPLIILPTPPPMTLLPPTYREDFSSWFFLCLITAAFVLLFFTVWRLFGKPSPREKLIWLAVWTLGPPSWFTIEAYWVYPHYRHANATYMDFKNGQDVASKFWAGVVAFVAAVALKKEEQPPNAEVVIFKAELQSPHVAAVTFKVETPPPPAG